MKLPAQIRTLLGPVSVSLVEDLHDGDRSLLGLAQMDVRTIQIAAELPDEKARATLWHEIVHFLLHDTGVENMLSEDGLEVMCSTIGTQLAVLGVPFPK